MAQSTVEALCSRFRNHSSAADLKRMAPGGADNVENGHVLIDLGFLEPVCRARPSSGWVNSCGLLRQNVVGSGSRSQVLSPSRLNAGALASADVTMASSLATAALKSASCCSR
eukprot:7648043-Pyramimonas_sp.AAC.1